MKPEDATNYRPRNRRKNISVCIVGALPADVKPRARAGKMRGTLKRLVTAKRMVYAAQFRGEVPGMGDETQVPGEAATQKKGSGEALTAIKNCRRSIHPEY